MPHPQRASEEFLGNADGARLFRSFATALLLGRTAFGPGLAGERATSSAPP
ncbi:MAG: hypothetical protein KJ062_22990 [Thermoanaerobaculia bacterium]|nr:hypothetical protein [Thermoanaerobaculia bacterium]